jgi:hypothetical protein
MRIASSALDTGFRRRPSAATCSPYGRGCLVSSTHLGTRHGLALVHARSGRYDEAETEYRGVLARRHGYWMPSTPTPSPPGHNLALVLERQGRQDDAGKDCHVTPAGSGDARSLVALIGPLLRRDLDPSGLLYSAHRCCKLSGIP